MFTAPFLGRCVASGALALALIAPGVVSAQVRQALFQGYPQGGYASRAAGGQPISSDTWMNAYGEPVVMPASYCGGACGPGMMGGGCRPGMMGGCGMCGGGGCQCCMGGGGPYPPGGPFGDCSMDPACDLYGSGGVDQCGPHYFDFSAEALYWKRDQAADPDVLFATIGITDVSLGVDESLALSTGDIETDYEPGVRLTGRYDLGALSFLEVGYSGLFEWGGVGQLNGSNDIYTAFSNFGIGVDTTGDGVPDSFIGGAGLNGTELVNAARLEITSELHNAEFNVRRYWIGFNPRVTGTFLAGFRYTRLSEDLNFRTFPGAGSAVFASQTENDLLGFQAGGDVWVTVRQGCRIGAVGKAGIYNNRMESALNATSTDRLTELVEVTKGDRAAFIAEGGVAAVFDVFPSWSVRAGYDVLFINTVALAANNFNFDAAPFDGGTRTPVLIEESSTLFHGANLGLEYVW